MTKQHKPIVKKIPNPSTNYRLFYCPEKIPLATFKKNIQLDVIHTEKEVFAIRELMYNIAETIYLQYMRKDKQ